MIKNTISLQEKIIQSVSNMDNIRNKRKNKMSLFNKLFSYLTFFSLISSAIYFGLSGFLIAWLVLSFIYIFKINKEIKLEEKYGSTKEIENIKEILTLPHVKNKLIEKIAIESIKNKNLKEIETLLIKKDMNLAINSLLLSHSQILLDLDIQEMDIQVPKEMEIGSNMNKKQWYKNII